MENCPWKEINPGGGRWDCAPMSSDIPEYLPEPIAADEIEVPNERDMAEE